jgi:CRISPR/Cas system-associated exonuclease Cas4 (RecB family)
MYDEADLLPISALQHLAFCERQWALIHLEGQWAENPLTVEGHHLHDRTHQPETESRGDLRIARGLRLRSLRLGLSGIADVVEFHRVDSNEVHCHSERSEEPRPDPQTRPRLLATARQRSCHSRESGNPVRSGDVDPRFRGGDEGSSFISIGGPQAHDNLGMTQAGAGQGTGLPAGVPLPGLRGLWQPAPVEYKRGRPKLGPYDEIQLCAQALCLEEMLGVAISAGALYYGQPHQRQEVALNVELRERTEKLAARLHELTRIGRTPLAIYEKKCERCSLLTLCMPRTTGGRKSVDRYVASMTDW